MKILLTAVLITMTCCVHAQSLTANELISKAKCVSFECYNEFIVKKGFSFERSFVMRDTTSYLFLSDSYVKTTNSEAQVKNSSAITIIKNQKNTAVGFWTGNKEYYNKLFSGFQTLGFKPIKNSPANNEVQTLYESKSYPNITLIIDINKSSNEGQSWTAYNFQVAAWR